MVDDGMVEVVKAALAGSDPEVVMPADRCAVDRVLKGNNGCEMESKTRFSAKS